MSHHPPAQSPPPNKKKKTEATAGGFSEGHAGRRGVEEFASVTQRQPPQSSDARLMQLAQRGRFAQEVITLGERVRKARPIIVVGRAA